MVISRRQQRESESAWWHARRSKLVVPKRTMKAKAADPHYNPDPAYGKFCYAAKDGDVVISLSTYDKDCLLIPSKVLMEKSQWFSASLCDRWVAQKTTADGLKRYELEYETDEDGPGCILMGKTHQTPKNERLHAVAAVLDGKSLETYSSDEPRFRTLMSFGPWPRGTPENVLALIEEGAAIMVHKLGLSLLLGIPLQPHLNATLKYLDGFRTYVLAELLAWIDIYLDPNDYEAMRPLLNLVLKPEYASEIARYPCIYLRFACLVRSEELFKAAIVWAQEQGNLAQRLGGNADLMERVYEYRACTDYYIQQLYLAISTVRLVDTPTDVSVLAEDIFRRWINTWCHTSLHQIYSGSVCVDEVLEFRPYSRPWDGSTYIKHVLMEHLRQGVEKICKQARGAMNRCSDGEVCLTTAIDYKERILFMPNDGYWRYYVFPWQQRKLPATESRLTAMVARASLEYDEWVDSWEFYE